MHLGSPTTLAATLAGGLLVGYLIRTCRRAKARAAAAEAAAAAHARQRALLETRLREADSQVAALRRDVRARMDSGDRDR